MSARASRVEALPGLCRVVVPTAAGMVAAHVGRASPGGVATVLLHGAAGSSTTWTPLVAASALHDLVIIDLPGWGESPGPVPAPAMLACTVADVVRALGYERWVIVGHSLGGAVALDVAARFAAQTVAVGLVSPSGAGVRDAVLAPVRAGARLPAFAGMLVAMRLLRGLGRAAGPLLRTLRRSGMLRLLAAPLFASPVDRSVTDALADEIRPAEFLAAAARAGDVDVSLWRRIRVPVRSVHGRRDVFARRDDDAYLARIVPDFAVRVLDGAGHFAHVERPAETLDALADVWAAGRAAELPAELARGVGAAGVEAKGVGAAGVGATGVGATGVGATGVGATGVGAAPIRSAARSESVIGGRARA